MINGIGNLFSDSIYLDNRRNKEMNSKTNFEECLKRKTAKEVTKSETDKKMETDKKTETDSNIIVKPDGSRVIVVTTKIGNFESTMSIELSGPNEWDQTNPSEELTKSKDVNIDETIIYDKL